MRNPGFSIVIPSFKRFHILQRTLRYFQNQEYPVEGFEIVIVFDGKSDLNEEEEKQIYTLSKKMRIRIFFSPLQKGQAFCRNIGIFNSSGRYLLFMDDDTLPGKKLLTEHLRILETGRQLASLGVVKTIMKTPVFTEPYTFLSENSLSQIAVPPGMELKPEEVYSGNLAVRKMDDLYFNDTVFNEYGYEDVFFGSELIRRRINIIKNTGAVVFHMKLHDQDSFLKRSIQLGESHRKMAIYPRESTGKQKTAHRDGCNFRNGLKKILYYKRIKDENFTG